MDLEGKKMPEQMNQEQIHALLFEEKMSWRSIIYDLINSEQLDPWNIDLSLLAQRYLEKVRLLEEANFFVSSNVLLVASLLLRLKSEIVLNEDLPALDDILNGRKDEEEDVQERLEFDEDVPELVPRTPLPRFRKVTLEELMAALGKAIGTENRRIKKQILIRQQEREVALALPKRTINLQQHIALLYEKLQNAFSGRDGRLSFSELASHSSRDEKIIAFVSLLHLDNQQKIWLEQEGHFEEIWVWLKELYQSKNHERLESIRLEVEAFMREAEKEQEKSDASVEESSTDSKPDNIEIDDEPTTFLGKIMSARDKPEEDEEED